MPLPIVNLYNYLQAIACEPDRVERKSGLYEKTILQSAKIYLEDDQ